jgi:hypothetical protein
MVKRYGTSGNDTFIPFGSGDYVYGLAGDDRLDDQVVEATFLGGLGDDFYVLNLGRNKIIEKPGEGYDVVEVNFNYNYKLPANVEEARILSYIWGSVTGNDLNNVLIGGFGDDSLDGGKGADRLVGGGGNDYYGVDNTGDVVVEKADGGTDEVAASISYKLGLNVENLTLTGRAAINGTGNALANTITGNAAANVLSGGKGDDKLYGGSGADTLDGGAGSDLLDGGAGADILRGGLGVDHYIVDNRLDQIIEAGTDKDSIKALVSYVLPKGVEAAFAVGGIAAKINLTGNVADNFLLGNDGDNVLKGEGGNDFLMGYGGNDTIDGGAGNDTLIGQGNLTGGAGADTFFFASTREGAVLPIVVADFVHGTDRIALNSKSLTGSDLSGPVTTDQFWAGTAAHDASDRLIYDSATGKLYYDGDGSGAGGQELIGAVTPGTVLDQTDIVWLSNVEVFTLINQNFVTYLF